MGQNENRQASEPALSPEQQRKAKRTEIAARIPTKGKNKLWTQAKAEDVAEYIATLTDDAAVQQATADKYIADIKEKQAKMDAIEALELNDDIAFWESVKGLLAPVETQTEGAPEALPAPTAENEMQPVAEVAQQPMTEVQSEDAGEPVGETEQLNQSGVNTGTRLTNEASNEEHPSVSKAELQDALAFAEAYSLNTVEAYQAYLDRSPEGAYRDGARNGMWVLEGAEEANSEAIERAMDVISQAPSGVYADNQGNPVDADGKMVIDEVNSIDEITDEDFETPTRNVQLPAIPENVANAIGTNGRPIVIKKNVFEKNGNTHVELEPEDSRNILRSALYNPNLVGSTQPIRRPDYKVAIRTGEQNAVVVLDVYQEKDFVEIVGWRMVNEKGLAKMQRQAEREGGQFLILSPNDGSAAALSALPLGLSSEGENTTQSANSQENSVKSGENTQNRGEKDVIEEMREQNRVAEEREQRAGVPPRVSDYSSAINAEDTEAQKAWEDKFNDFLAKLTIDDLPTIDGTISSMQGNKEAIKAGDPGGYKENPNYKAFDYIEKALKKRKRELEKSSTNGEKSQEIEDNSTTGGEETAPNASQQGEPADIEINGETRADKATEEAVLKYYSRGPINTATATSKQMSSDGTFDVFQFDDLVEFAEEIGAVSPIKIEPKIMGGKMMTIASVAERSAIELEAAYRSGNRKKIEREEKNKAFCLIVWQKSKQ